MKTRIMKIAKLCISVCILVLIVSNLLIVSELNSTVDDLGNIDYAVVLGAGLEGDKVSNRLKKRLDLAFEEVKDTGIPIIVSGGQGEDELISEAEAMFLYLTEKGMDSAKIIKEEESTSTKENITFSDEIIDKENVRVVIFTSDYHMYRAKMLGKREGWKVGGFSAKNSFSERIRFLLRENIALIKDIIVVW